MALKIETEDLAGDSAVVLHCHGDLDAHTFEILDNAIAELFDEDKSNIIIDLSGVPYMSSAGIGVLVGSRTEAEGNGGGLVLLNPVEVVLDVFRSMGFDSVFMIVQSDTEALSALGLEADTSEKEKEQEAGRARGRRKDFD